MRSMKSVLGFAFAVASFGAVALVPRAAHAGLEACNNIEVSADARCQVLTQGGCTAQCEPVNFDLQCSAKLEATCNGQCAAQADVSCTGSCQADCLGTCQANPGTLDCSANCKASCEADCSGKCSAQANQAECEASCKACCGGHCDAKCTGTPPSATCDAKCQASCSGSCEGKANIDCQVSCQAKGYADCTANLSGGCKAQCTQPSGALFCDGQYVDTGNNLQNCVDALNAYLHVKVEASGTASCDGGECNAEGSAKATCAAAPGDSPVTAGALLAGLGAIGLSMARRRRRSSRR